jgi:arylsulfatase A-like enzyme
MDGGPRKGESGVVPTPPNILWIVTTQWRAQACGYAGDPNARTPCLDQLAGRASNYLQAVTPHPFGPFARAAMLTGLPSPQNGVRDYFDPLPRDRRTLAHELADAGYATAFFGKWHLGRRDRAAPLVGEAHAKTVVPPDERGGFAFWEGFESGFLLNDSWLHGTRLPEPTRFPGYQSDVLCQRAAEWLGRTGPWFCVVSLEAPHPPYDAPSAGVPRRDPAALILAPNVAPAAESRARHELAGYYAHLEATDRAIGALLAAADAPDTITVFTSVHGDMHGAHGLFRKGWPHEESVRVPLLVRVPGGPVGRDASPVSLLDLPAMTLAWAWGKPPPAAPPAAHIAMPSVVALPHQCDRIWSGLRTANRKLVLHADGSPWLFFDLEADPWEMRNLASRAEHAAEIASWRDRIASTRR